MSAHPLSAEGISQASVNLSGDQLNQSLQGSIGATLMNSPGIHSASFGEAVGRPVIHGLGGARVRIMEDRIDSMDVSVTSSDHGVSIEPFIADQIEVLKGSGTLLYGSGAIGGVVDVHTGRIPHQIRETTTGKLELRNSDNNHQQTGAIRLDGSIQNVGWHLDAFGRDANDYQIPGSTESRQLHALEDHEEELSESGKVAGTRLRSAGGAAGMSWIGERGFAGIAISRFTGNYGLPGGHGHEEEHLSDGLEPEEESHDDGFPVLDMEQTRVDMEAALEDPFTGIENINFRAGINNYQHREIEPDGEVATRFENDAYEIRVELTHQEIAGWQGVIGLQHNYRDFSAIGEESFTPPVTTQGTGLFWLSERSFDQFQLEAGIRVEQLEHDPDNLESRDFSLLSGSVGAIIPFNQYWQLALLGDYSSRAPVTEELYSNGPHLATRSFELGNPGLKEERAYNLSANLQRDGDHWQLAATLYATEFRDFIYQSATGDEQDGLPVFLYQQQDARFTGLDLQASVRLYQSEDQQLWLKGKFDQVKATLDVSGNDNIPRIPPQRYGLGIAYDLGALHASVDYTRYAHQTDIADLELPTDGYHDLSAYLGYSLKAANSDLEIFLKGKNLTDQEQRNHTSFIKDQVPLPGRTLEAGIRLVF